MSVSKKKNSKSNYSKSTKNNKRNNTNKSKKVNKEKSLNVDIATEILGISVFIFCIVLFLSSINLCGGLGDFINGITFGLFGVFAYILPFVIFLNIFIIMANSSNKNIIIKVILSDLIIIVFMSLCEIFLRPYGRESFSAFQVFMEKNGGGLVSSLIVNALLLIFNKLVSIFILFILLMGLLFIFNEKSFVNFIKLIMTKTYYHTKNDINSAVRSINGYREKRKNARIYDEYDEYDEESYTDYEDEYEYDYDYESFEKPKFNEWLSTDKFNNKKENRNENEKIYDVINNNKVTNKKKLNLQKSENDNIKKADMPIHIYNKEPVIDDLDKAIIEKAEEILKNKEKHYYKVGNTDNLIFTKPKEDNSPIYKENIAVSAASDNDKEEVSTKEEIKENYNEIDLKTKFKDESDINNEKKLKTVVETSTGKIIEKEKEDLINLSAQKEKDKEYYDRRNNFDFTKREDFNDSIIKPSTAPYVFPPISLLSKPSNSNIIPEEQLRTTAKKLQDTLHNFGVEVSVSNISCGPTVTRYEIQPKQGVKVSKIVSLTDDIKLSLAASDIRVEAPIPGKSAVGIEVPNKVNNTVFLREILESQEYKNSDKGITFAIGKDIAGKNVIEDITKMPHVLIAGATGSGKSVCINTLIMSILYKYSPDEVKLIMVDPKMVELSLYNGIPHLIIPVVTDPKKATAALNWAVSEMNRRYKVFADSAVKDIEGYNQKVDENKLEGKEKLPKIAIIIDELADLMMVASSEVESCICRIAQLARAAGIYLIIATQRPSVNVITGIIKANIPSRIAFSVTSNIDSRTILDSAGAEKLLGKGDMLYAPRSLPKPVRVQGAFISEKDVSNVVEFIKAQIKDHKYDENMIKTILSEGQSPNNNSVSDDYDELFFDAGALIIDREKASIGLLQRCFKIGFNRAARIMDQLCEAGVVSEEQSGNKPREIIMDREAFDSKYGG